VSAPVVVLPSRQQVIERAGDALAAIVAEQDGLSVEVAAREACWRGGPSLDEVAAKLARVRANRAARARGLDMPVDPPLRVSAPAAGCVEAVAA